MTLTGAPARLRPLPRLLLRIEVPVSGSAAAATFAVHAVREAIYLSPGHGHEKPDAQESPATCDSWAPRWNPALAADSETSVIVRRGWRQIFISSAHHLHACCTLGAWA